MPHHRSKGFLICFSGLDGTGKSVHALKLSHLLKLENYSCKCIHGRWDPSLSYPFLAFLRLIGITRKIKKGNLQYLERSLNRVKPISLLWEFFIVVDETIATFFKVTLPLMSGTTVICDRYVYDVIADAAADLESESSVWKFPLKLAFKTTPTPDISFLMDAPESCAFGRKKDTPSMKYLRIRKRLFLNMTKYFPFTIIDSTQPAFQVDRIILSKMQELATFQEDKTRIK
jgi:thymidylate kinase